ncbi:MAG: hypothetical protein LBL28_03190 [Treponema sp.]|jgi:hypothetical protein|nr:hypothetical protein [Treponema sp.]
MPLLTQYASFFMSPFGEKTVCDELNAFLKSTRIVNVEKRLSKKPLMRHQGVNGEPAEK